MSGMLLSSLLPVVLLVLLGWWLRVRGWFSSPFFLDLNRLVFFIGLPALLVAGISGTELHGGAWRPLGVVLGTAAVMVLLAYPVAGMLRLNARSRGAFVQAALRGNIAYIGLPLVIYAFSDRADSSGIEALAMLTLAPVVPVYNIVCVSILTQGPRAGAAGGTWWKGQGRVWLTVVRNPLLLACLVGLAIAWSGLRLPMLVDRTLRLLGQMALPLALLSIGASLSLERIRGRMSAVWVASVLKVFVSPAVGWLIGRWMGLAGDELRMVLVFLACPSAVSGYVMAEQLGSDAELAGSAVVLSTVMSLPALVLVLLVT